MSIHLNFRNIDADAYPDSEANERDKAGERVAAALRHAVVRVFRDEKPSNVVGFLIANREPATIYAIAGAVGASVDTVKAELRDLEAEYLAVTISENGLDKVQRFAAFTAANS